VGGPDGADEAGAEALAGEKAALRRAILAARARLTESERGDAGRALRDAVLALPQAQMAGTVAIYHSIGAEPRTHGLVYAFWKRGSYVLLPLLRPDRDLDWACYEGPDSLGPGPRGLAEPTAPPRGTGAVASADLVVVPALAVDRRGTRLGRGGGSYDRALARVGTQVPTIALIYDGELLDEVPAAPHDQRVRLVARPSHPITGMPLP
jgi:5-formyltetrahydrofolate cyclo-ligase